MNGAAQTENSHHKDKNPQLLFSIESYRNPQSDYSIGFNYAEKIEILCTIGMLMVIYHQGPSGMREEIRDALLSEGSKVKEQRPVARNAFQTLDQPK
ncbi:uncharacterized protein LOC144207107 isoform X2 [Stigmatopora nigra]